MTNAEAAAHFAAKQPDEPAQILVVDSDVVSTSDLYPIGTGVDAEYYGLDEDGVDQTALKTLLTTIVI